MAHPEAPQPFANRIFLESATQLAHRGDSPTAAAASRVLDRIQNNTLFISTTNSDGAASATDFGLTGVADATDLLVPSVLLHPERTLNADPKKIKADAVRTIHIADQYPLNGYERRLRTVYAEALEHQATWLAENNTAPIPFDPRTTDHDHLVKRLLGTPQYLSDTGLKDWNSAVEYRSFYPLPDGTTVDPQLIASLTPERFLQIRAQLTPKIHFERVIAHSDQDEGPQAADQRAFYTSVLLVNHTLSLTV